MYFTQEQIDTIQLPIRWKRIKLEVLNTDFQTLATIDGNATGGSLQKDATSFVRRTGSVQMCVPNVASATAFLDYIDGVTVNINGKIWLDKNVKISLGIDNYNQPYGVEPKTVWYSFGICLIDAPVRTFSATGYTMEFNVVDLAAKMNGDRSGQLAITTTLFPRVQGYDANKKPIYTSTEQALASCIEELTEFKRYTIYPIPEKWATLPYDIKMEVGSTVYSALEQFLDILSGWQMYFDNEGVFVVEPIPSGANDIAYPLNLQLNTQDVNSVDFNYVRNQVIVYGRSHNIQFYPDSINWTDQGQLRLNFESLDATKIQVGSTIFGWENGVYAVGGIIYGDYLSDISIVVNGTPLFSNAPIYWYGDDTTAGVEIKNGVYVFRIRKATVDNDSINFTRPIELELLGRQQTQACIVNGNPESPYFVGKGYKTETHYGETGLMGWAGVLSYHIDVTLTDDWTTPQVGQILLFYIPVIIDTNPTVSVYNNSMDVDIPTQHEFSFSSTINLNGKTIGGDYSVWAFRYNGSSFDLLGRCPYANTLVESGGVYDNIYADSLARERAEYDLFLHTNVQNTITLSCVPDYSLDVNYRIKYNPRVALPPDANLSDDFEDKYFITKAVTYPLGLDGSAQTINAIEIYDDYNYVGYAYDLPTGT